MRWSDWRRALPYFARRAVWRLTFGLVPPGIWLMGGVALAAWYVYEVKVARPSMIWMGMPRAQEHWASPHTWTRVLRNHAYLVGYSEWRGCPLWVSYRLNSPTARSSHHPRPSRFHTDWRALNRVNHDDYTGSGYDRGHLAPNRAIGVAYGREAQLETFLMTNVVPQRNPLDRKLWARLEEVELDYFARRHGEIWVTTGPVFEPPAERLSSSWRVEVPDAFYKIVIAPAQQKAIAFIVPQTVQGNEPLDHYLVSVDSIERKTGLDFFHELDDRIENRMEAEVDPDFWHLRDAKDRAGHYAQEFEHGSGATSVRVRRKP